MKPLFAAIALLGTIGLCGCTQGDMEEIGEKADTAKEQATTGKTDTGQGQMEEVGEQHDKLDKN